MFLREWLMTLSPSEMAPSTIFVTEEFIMLTNTVRQHDETNRTLRIAIDKYAIQSMIEDPGGGTLIQVNKSFGPEGSMGHTVKVVESIDDILKALEEHRVRMEKDHEARMKEKESGGKKP